MLPLTEQLHANLLRARAVTAGLTHAQFNRQPEPGRWSIAECLTHLIRVNQLDIEPIREAIADGRQRGLTGSPPFQYGWLSRKFLSMMEPPATTKIKAPSAYVPPGEAQLQPTLAEYERTVRTIEDLYRSASGLDLSRIKTIFPAAPALIRPLLKMPVGARFEVLAAHDRRHLWQAEQVRQALFSGAPRAEQAQR